MAWKRYALKIIAITALAACTPSTSGQAQNDWLGTATNILNSPTSSNILKSLGGGTNTGIASSLTNTQIDAGLREALRIGTSSVVSQLGAANGFNADPKIHIPLPGTLARVDSALSAVGMGGLTNDLELRLNRAAELATPKAKALFVNAISQMTITDAKNILTGPQDSATQFLRKAMSPQLRQDMQPLIQNALSQAGAVKAYDQAIGQYAALPFVPDVKANLNSYVTDKAMDGIFYYVAQEEAAIRTTPAARTTDLLKTVFGAVR